MPVTFQDYYQTLGVARTASTDEIQRAYRQLARKLHPDVNKADDAQAKFAQLTEAYEVLKDAEKRKQYDLLGENWKAGQEFRPPPGAGGRRHHTAPGGGEFSDFFETFFGGGGGAGGGGGINFDDLLSQLRGQTGGGASGGRRRTMRQPDQEAELTISLHEAIHGSTRRLDLTGPQGRKTVEVKVPAGVGEGAKIRLGGEGLVLVIHVDPYQGFTLEGRDITGDLDVSAWDAALGAKVHATTPHGDLTVTIPAGSSSGRLLRLRGKGLPAHGSNPAGDLRLRVRITVPKTLTDEQKKLFEQLRGE